jgi:DtxR family Mn-dependent transcriptional regulator
LPKEDTEEYLEAILDLGGEIGWVKTTDLSKRLEVCPASVTEKVQRLARVRLVTYRPYGGVRLTEKGKRQALHLKRKHRLLEVFLFKVLHITPSNVHEEACKMEHVLSDEAERAMCRLLGGPDTCPHGSVIPPCETKTGSCAECLEEKNEPNTEKADACRDKPQSTVEAVPLSSLSQDETGRVVLIRGGNNLVMRLCRMGLTPGAKVKMKQAAPMHGPVQITVKGCDLALGHGIARKIFVERRPADETDSDADNDTACQAKESPRSLR